MDSNSSIKIGIIGGSGIGALLGENQERAQKHPLDTPFGPTSDAIVETAWHGVTVFLLSRHGPGHTLNPSQVPYRANIFALKQLGCTHVIATGAVGSLREEFRPRDLVIPDQIIDKTFRRPGTFFEKAAVHVEFAEPFDAALRRMLLEGSGFDVQASGSSSGEKSVPPPEPRTVNAEPSFTVHDRGCYVCMEGPAFSTRAESIMNRLSGGDLIGMTAMPEAKLAREAEMAYALVALVTDYDCWKQPPASQRKSEEKIDPFALLEEIIGNLNAASGNAMQLIRRTIERIGEQPARIADSAAHHALRLGIWSDKTRIDAGEIDRLRPLWGKYFDGVNG